MIQLKIIIRFSAFKASVLLCVIDCVNIFLSGRCAKIQVYKFMYVYRDAILPTFSGFPDFSSV